MHFTIHVKRNQLSTISESETVCHRRFSATSSLAMPTLPLPEKRLQRRSRIAGERERSCLPSTTKTTTNCFARSRAFWSSGIEQCPKLKQGNTRNKPLILATRWYVQASSDSHTLWSESWRGRLPRSWGDNSDTRPRIHHRQVLSTEEYSLLWWK